MRQALRSPLALGAILGWAAWAPGPVGAAAVDQFPESGSEAMDLYENRVDQWLDGPVFYILLNDEIRAFKALESSAERAHFIRWFWARRDDDLRDQAHPFRDAFYTRVAEANRRYNEFPRGWRSDRGRMHVVLGRPDGIRPQMGQTVDSVVWTYYTVGARAQFRSFDSSLGELSLAFVRTRNRSGYQIYGGFGGPGVLPRYVIDVIDSANMAAIVDPFLDRTAVP